MKKWYYVYEIVYKDFMKYLGYRGCYGHPELDCGYLGSGTATPDDDQVLFKNILYITRDEVKAYEAETWHLEYVDARNNSQYYNQHNNGCFGFYSSEQASEQMKSQWADPDSVFNSKEYRQKRSETLKAVWANPNSAHNSEEYRQKISEIQKTLWEDEEHRQKMIETHNTVRADEEYKQKMSEIQKTVWADEKLKQKRSETQKDKRLWHFYKNGRLVVSTYYEAKQNSKTLFDLGSSSVSRLKGVKRKQIKGWYCLGIPHQIVKFSRCY